MSLRDRRPLAAVATAAALTLGLLASGCGADDGIAVRESGPGGCNTNPGLATASGSGSGSGGGAASATGCGATANRDPG
jgi:hypothetical protein